MRLGGFPDLGFGCFGSAGSAHQPLLRRFERGRDLVREETGLAGSALRLEDVEDLLEGADAGQTVADDEVVIERAHRQAGDESVDPDGEPGQFDGHQVQVDAVDAAAGDLTAQQRSRFDLHAGGVLPERGAGCLGKPGQLVADRRDLLLGEEGGELRLDPVDGGDQEVAGAHRQVRDPEVEERFRGAASSPRPSSARIRARCSSMAGSSAVSSRCSTANCLVKYEPVALRCPDWLWI